ncbi:MAG: IucA/IucC family siderophore biosynthesis protein [Oligoflexia bacterium]|nr:IucA/IucC family siderophore biosynthesis protein [Oligoflexia bacterium]
MENNFINWAKVHSENCFLNAFLREWPNSYVTKKNEIHISLGKKIVVLPLAKYSKVGRHHYLGSYYLLMSDKKSEISFEQFLTMILENIAEKFQISENELMPFKKRYDDSKKNIENILRFRKKSAEDISHSFVSTEQSLIVGHNFHPTPKSRDEFSDEDLRSYSPEFCTKFSIDWFLADPNIVHNVQTNHFQTELWSLKMLRLDMPEAIENFKIYLNKGYVPYPLHPWQTKVLSKELFFSEYKKEEKIIYLGKSNFEWKPTSSLRSLYRENSPYMLKFSMSLKLTNSIRHLLVHEVERGLQLEDVLSTQKGKDFLEKNPNFHILTEPAFLCLKNPKGNNLSETVVVCRKNAFMQKDAENKLLLATLTQDGLYGRDNLLLEILKNTQDDLGQKEKVSKWFKMYLETVLSPLFDAQANYGILLGAHQQNLILEICEGYPTKAFFRDCQGTGYSELGYKNFAKEVALITRENGNVLDDDMGKYLFSYYLIINSTFNVIAALASASWISEEELINDLRSHLELLLKFSSDKNCLNYLLYNSELMNKGNFLCSFKSINENTTENPLSIYTPIKNPLSGVNSHA